MQENHSFDQYFGRLNQSKFYGKKVDGLMPEFYNQDILSKKHYPHHSDTLCTQDTDHQYWAMHMAWNKGKNDGFVKWNGFGRKKPEYIMSYFDETDIPFYYSLANTFAIADRYFGSGLTGTYPNRLFLLSGTAGGEVNTEVNLSKNFKWKTFFQLLNEYNISWKYYKDGKGYLFLFKSFYDQNQDKVKSLADYKADLANNNLPTIAFLDAPWDTHDEHPPVNIQHGYAWVGDKILALMGSPSWKSSAIFFTYDENGGFFDHVPPPTACLPDDKRNKAGLWKPDVHITAQVSES
jgi:phospholipase C